MFIKHKEPLVISLCLSCFCFSSQAQNGSGTADQAPQLRVMVGPPNASTDSVIALPPATSWTTTIDLSPKHTAKAQEPSDVPAWIQKEAALNGLQSADLRPWHITIAYDQFDEDGDNVHSGVLDELWAGPKKYKISYKSDNITQTDYATDRGLFRTGDQRWPNTTELQLRSEVADPFYYAATLQGFHTKNLERSFGAHSLDCVLLQSETGAGPTEYCFEHGGSALRYSRGFGWFQTTYNDITSFQGRNVAREVEVTDGGKPHLKLHVTALEEIANVDDKEFMPPDEATILQGKRLSGVSPKPLHQKYPEWPSALRQQHFSVTVEIVVGKDGHVESAHAVSGPSNAYKAAEDAARQWTFQPYLVLDEPAEVETKIILSHN
ncbi:MAG: hypothetical protein DMG60_15465 [Acidobacteria bacterium]|nr:MAG: hypothetical protein DMG60_15465 [Acidobacteriota bacterium]